jgi:hypothetical protein
MRGTENQPPENDDPVGNQLLRFEKIASGGQWAAKYSEYGVFLEIVSALWQGLDEVDLGWYLVWGRQVKL